MTISRICLIFTFVFHALFAEAEYVDINGIRYKLDVVNKVAEVSKGLKTEWEYVNILETIEYNNDVYQVTSIGKDAFAECSYMMGITIPNSVVSIGENAFAHCSSLTELIIPYGLTDIADKTFFGCTNLISISIPKNVSVIGKYAFADCHLLQSVTIPNRVTTIEDYAFRKCSSLISVTIPESVEYIGQEAFWGCSSIEQVSVRRTTPPFIYSDTFPYYSVPVYVPKGCASDYMNADNWKSFATINDSNFFLELESIGMMTFCVTEDLDFSGLNGLEAYIASGFNKQTGKLLITRVYDVPAGTGLLLKGTPGAYSIPYVTSHSVYANLLEGVTSPTTIAQTSGDYTNYILSLGTHGIGFYIVSGSGEIVEGKAYLKIPSSIAAHRVSISIDYSDQISGVDGITSDCDDNAVYYDLQGRYINGKPSMKGIYISNAQKILVR